MLHAKQTYATTVRYPSGKAIADIIKSALNSKTTEELCEKLRESMEELSDYDSEQLCDMYVLYDPEQLERINFSDIIRSVSDVGDIAKIEVSQTNIIYGESAAEFYLEYSWPEDTVIGDDLEGNRGLVIRFTASWNREKNDFRTEVFSSWGTPKEGPVYY